MNISSKKKNSSKVYRNILNAQIVSYSSLGFVAQVQLKCADSQGVSDKKTFVKKYNLAQPGFDPGTSGL